MSLARRLLNMLRPNRHARDVEREMAFHFAERVDALVAGGMSGDEARREARRRFGNPEIVGERVHDVDVVAWLESLLGDVRYAGRALRAHPGFTLVAVLSLALGIGANTAIFSLINAVMLRSLPVRHPEELVQVAIGDGNTTLTNPLWEAIRDRQDALAGAFAFADQQFNLTSGGAVRRTGGALVSGDYFRVLGVSAAVGRLLEPADDVRGCAGVAVLGYGFWQREYGGALDAVGRTISLNGHAFEIVGVAQPGFSGIHVGRSAGVFAPICSIAITGERSDILDGRSTWWLNVFGRLRQGGELEEAQARLGIAAPGVFEATVPTHWSADEQQRYKESALTALPAARGLSYVRGQYQNALYTLLVVVGIVLLIACANVAQLLLARATARHHEIGVRLTLGSGRARLVRQLLTESVMLALMGAVLGTAFAGWSSRLVVGLLSQGGRSVFLDLSLDLRVLGFTILVATVTGLLFGLAPAWRSSRVSPQVAMRSAGRGQVGDSRHRLAKGLVVGQVALSLVLVVAATLLVGSFRRLASVDPGFRPNGVLIVSASWTTLGLPNDQYHAYSRGLLEAVRTIPGVRSASGSLITPISGTAWNDDVDVDGFTPQDPHDRLAWFNGVSEGYMDTFGTRLLAGRDFGPDDGADAPRVALVNQTMARHFFGGANPIGGVLHTLVHDSLGPPIEVVGMVEDAKYQRVDEEALPTVYLPLDQTEPWSQYLELALRASGDPTGLVPDVTEAMRRINPAIALEFTTLHAQVAISLARPRLLATLSGFFGGLALLLAVIGLYGTMSYSVARRRNEIGVRIALGAARAGILRMVAGEAGLVIAVGVVLGTGIALAVTRLVAGFLYGVTASDPLMLALSALVLASVAMVAGLVPAWRAAAVDPMVALREE